MKKNIKYGDKRDYRKIDIYTRNTKGVAVYECSTTWAKTCKQAKENFLRVHNYLASNQVVARFA
jgi:hypothetical protein